MLKGRQKKRQDPEMSFVMLFQMSGMRYWLHKCSVYLFVRQIFKKQNINRQIVYRDKLSDEKTE